MIELKNISKTYLSGSVQFNALKGVSLQIKEGEFVAIMGPSGSGKSTLMHIMGALDSPTGGQYLLDGKDVSKLDSNQLSEIRNKEIGFVFQSFNLLPRTSVIRNVTLPLIYMGVEGKERAKRAHNALAQAQLDDSLFSKMSNQLSGGQIQRVAIARALVNDSKIILADEPTGNLDSKTGDMILEVFKKLNREKNKTIIIITHELEVADKTDRTIIIRDGQIVEDRLNKHTN